jgi:hypothetical protein
LLNIILLNRPFVRFAFGHVLVLLIGHLSASRAPFNMEESRSVWVLALRFCKERRMEGGNDLIKIARFTAKGEGGEEETRVGGTKTD